MYASVSSEPLRQKDTLSCLSLTMTSFRFVTKEYLKSLGNSECSPQTFLENSSSLDKLLIIIRNEDIAAHVHKVMGPFYYPNMTPSDPWSIQHKLYKKYLRLKDPSSGVLEEVAFGELCWS